MLTAGDYATGLAAVLMFGSFLVELVMSRMVFHDRHHDLADTRNNLIIGAGYLVSRAFLSLLTAGVLVAVWKLSPWRWSMSSPWHWLVLLLAEDFLYYWSHRASHAFRMMWVSHVVHHNSPKLNLGTAMRNSWVGGYLDWVFFLPLVALGFHPLAIAVVEAGATAWDFLTHTPYFPKSRWLDWIFNSPSNHRVHHATNREYVNKNFGGALIVWDRLFGTYAAEGAPPVYGTSPMPTKPNNPFHLEFYLWWELLKGLPRLLARKAPRTEPDRD